MNNDLDKAGFLGFCTGNSMSYCGFRATNLEQDNFNLSKMRKLLLKFAHNSAETIMGPTLLESVRTSLCKIVAFLKAG